LVITTAEVQEGKILCTLKSIEYLVYMWYGALIVDGKIVKCRVVQAHPQDSIVWVLAGLNRKRAVRKAYTVVEERMAYRMIV
jgi:hypothetical protein